MESRLDSDYVQKCTSHNYEKIKNVQENSFPYHGQKHNYKIRLNMHVEKSQTVKFNLRDAVSIMCEKNPNRVIYGVDLGTGEGKVPESLNNEFNGRVKMIGITAEESHIPPEHIIYGNIETLLDIEALKTKKFDFFVSSKTFLYLGNPLKVISDIYSLLNENGFLFLDDVYILLPNLNNLFFQKLRDQGYDIIAGINNYNPSSQGFWGPGFLFIRKNKLEKLDFPVEYDGHENFKTMFYPFGNKQYPQILEQQAIKYKIKSDVALPVWNISNDYIWDPDSFNKRKLIDWDILREERNCSNAIILYNPHSLPTGLISTILNRDGFGPGFTPLNSRSLENENLDENLRKDNSM